jgi:Glucodextranase, domain B/FecR protein
MAASRLEAPPPDPRSGPEPERPFESSRLSRLLVYVAVAVGVLALGAGIYYFIYGRITPPPPPPPPPVNIAHFSYIEGAVKVKTVTSPLVWRDGDTQLPLGAGDLIRTWPKSIAEVIFKDETVVRLSPESLITIEPPSQQRIAYEIRSGEVNLRTPAGANARNPTTVGMPSGRGVVAPASQADFSVGTGYSDVRVTSGQVDLETTAGDRARVGPDEGLRIDASGRAGPKMRLPAMPTLVAPPHLVSLNPGREGAVRFEWQPLAQAVGYRFMLDRTVSFAAPIADDKDLTRPWKELRGLEPGDYYWRVAALGPNGVSGRFSTVSRLNIGGSRGSAPDLILQSVQLHGNIVQVKGKTDPGATVTINGQRLKVEADGTFSDFVALKDAGKQAVVIRAKGQESELFTEKKVTVDVRMEG